jgi:hypothetical protein
MNTRGLMELVILNIGQDIAVISPATFDDGPDGLGHYSYDPRRCLSGPTRLA